MTVPIVEEADGRVHRDAAFLGHPRGLAILSFSEAWERFSYYGMQALLVLYATHQLLLPGHVEHVWGFAGFRAMLEGVYGPLDTVGLASAITGLYAGFVYLTPIAGGAVADRLTGRTRAVAAGAMLMALGHFLMAFDRTFLIALACILTGVGLFKGNIAAQVGDLYAPDDGRRADAFQLYFLGIQVAVIVAPIVCGWLGERIAWHWGFGAAGVGMAFGLVIYLSGLRWLPRDTGRRIRAAGPRARLASGEGARVLVLVLLIPALALTAVGNQQIFNAYELWGEAHLQRTIAGWTMPVTFLISLDALVSTAMLVAMLAFWRLWSRRFAEPDEITKMIVGTALAAAAPLALALGSLGEAATGAKVPLGWALAFHLLNDAGFVNIFPVGLALYSRAAPKAVGGTMIAVYYIHLFIAGLIVSRLGGLLETMTPVRFWLLHAGLVAGGGALLLLARGVTGRLLAPDAAAAPLPAA